MMRLAAIGVLALAGTGAPQEEAQELLRRIGLRKGICALIEPERDALAVELARASELLVFVQLSDESRVTSLRRAAEEAGLLGTRVTVERGAPHRIHLADNLADAVVSGPNTPRPEVTRALRPGGRGIAGREEVGKPFPEGVDEWTHPYHGPDNNPQSKDRVARGPFMTQFMAVPWYAAMPQQSVMAGGRIFKAWGNRTSAQPQWAVIDTLMAMSAWNGTILWTRRLSPGFMIHRNTMIATPDLLYLGDDVSCKRLDAATGEVKDEIAVPEGISDGPVWKWMALEKGVLYALVGAKEKPEEQVKTGPFRGAGWPWWKISDYPFGFGRTILAIDVATKKVLWHHRDEELLDGRALCMTGGRLFVYSHPKFLAALDAATGRILWKNTDEAVLKAIGEHDAAQHWMKGFSSTAYAKCSEQAIYFAGPTRKSIVAVSTADGRLLWQLPGGNSQLVLREDGLYALGEASQNSVESSVKVHPLTGEILARFAGRDRCTRATGSAQFIFTRGGKGGSTAAFDVTSAQPRKGLVSPMRPACQDGVVVGNGLFYWGPWMCRCDNTQIGVISLGPRGAFNGTADASEAERLESSEGGMAAPLTVAEDDWPTFRKDNARSTRTSRALPSKVAPLWESAPRSPAIATAPVAAGGRVFVAGADGTVRSLDAESGREAWKVYTGGGVMYPPSIRGGCAYVGSGDGWVYCLEAKSGKTRWRFRAAPAERKVPVYGSLLSTWPVASGVLVEGGIAYAAAGNANLDGTHVFALDAESGKIRWQNHTSGHLADEREDSGAGVQGHLLLHDGALWMAGGSLAPLARYDLRDGAFSKSTAGRGKDLYVLDGKVQSSGFPLYWRPEDSHFISFAGFPVEGGFVAAAADHVGFSRGERDAKGQPRYVWSAKPFQETSAVVVAKDALLVAGVDRAGAGDQIRTTAGLAAVALSDGKILWRQTLPAAPSGWGLAVDRDGRILVSLQDGRVICFGAAQ